MINKIIACSDIHIPNFNGINDLKEILSTFIDKCKKVVKEEDSPENVRIVVAGDIFNNKTSASNEALLCADWFFKELDKICKTYIIIGNHDLLMNNMERVDTLTPLFEIGSYKQVIFLDRVLGNKSGILDDENIAWCLYSSFDGFNTPDIKMHKGEMEGKKAAPVTYVGLIHGDVNGAITNTNRVTENGLDPTVFEGCDFVIAGHIHKRQEIKKNGVRIVYCSSIKQKDMGESVTGHGFVLWDVEDPEEIEYKYVDIPNPNGGYFKFEVNGIDDLKNNKEELLNY